MTDLTEEGLEEILSDQMLHGITEGLNQFAEMLDRMAEYALTKSAENTTHPGQELYWGGFVDGLRTAAETARETRPLRGVK